jgi:hypothetical protein
MFFFLIAPNYSSILPHPNAGWLHNPIFYISLKPGVKFSDLD